MKQRQNLTPGTRVQHPPSISIPANNKPLIDPIYHSVKYCLDPVEEMSPGPSEYFFYSRISNPTTRQLELTLAELQQRDDAIVTASGIGAIATTLLGLCESGDHIIAFKESYRFTRTLLGGTLKRMGISHDLVHLGDWQSLSNAYKEKATKVLLFESPTNPSLSLHDIPRLTKWARERNLIIIMDNTFAGPHQHAEFDIDFYVHSLTKTVSGHGDVLGGAIISSHPLLESIRKTHWEIGATMDPQVAYQIQKGLKTFELRYKHSSKTSGNIARWLSEQSFAENVRYPGLQEPATQLSEAELPATAAIPSSQLFSSQLRDMGPVVTFDLKTEAANLYHHLRQLELISVTASLGATETLIAPCLAYFGGDLSVGELEKAGIRPTTLRLSVGLESEEDIKADLLRLS